MYPTKMFETFSKSPAIINRSSILGGGLDCQKEIKECSDPTSEEVPMKKHQDYLSVSKKIRLKEILK